MLCRASLLRSEKTISVWKTLSDKELPKPPQKSKDDTLHLGGQVTVSTAATLVGSTLGIPVLGGLLSAFYSGVLAPPLAKRTQEWMLILYERLKDLEKKTEGFKLEDLAENQLFITTFLHVYNIALRTHYEEKLEALRNVVINAAKLTNVEDDATLIFTNFIDTFTRWHIKIFVHLDETSQVINDFRASGKHFSMNALEKVLNDFPELNEDSDIAVQVIKDLQNRGLIKSDAEPEFILSKPHDESTSQSNTTVLGKRFVKIIH
jgi:hypothetical protein